MKTKAKNKEILELVSDIMCLCENAPVGGIGENGPTKEELIDAVERGRPINDDDSLHRYQEIWLKSNDLKKLLK